MPFKETRERLILEMKARKPEDGGGIPVGVFVTVVKSLEGLMAQVAKRQMGKKGGGIKFHISHLSHASPFKVEIVPFGGASDDAEQIVAGAEETLMRVARGETGDIPQPEYKVIGKIVSPVEKGDLRTAQIQRANGTVKNRRRPVDVNEKYVKNFNRGLDNDLRDVTTVFGRVEGIDLHSSPIKLKIYPANPKISPVVWRLPRDAEKTAVEIIGKRVAVTGDACYRADRQGIPRPHRIDAPPEQMRIIKPTAKNKRMLKIDELRGAFPGLTGGRDAAEYVRDLRGEGD